MQNYIQKESMLPLIHGRKEITSTLCIESNTDISRPNFALDYPKVPSFIRKLFEKLYHINHLSFLIQFWIFWQKPDILDEMYKTKNYRVLQISGKTFL